jgi:hypothetical protein
MRAVLFDANGDESRYLLETGDRAGEAKGAENKRASEVAFEAHVSAVTSLPDETKPSPKKLADYTLFAQLLRNMTFAGEKDAAAVVMRAFADYHKIDGKLRRLERSGKHAEAIELCIGEGEDGSNAAFAKLDTAVERMLAINRKAFASTIDLADGGLRTAEVWDPILAVAIALLAYLGMRPRLAEYAA